MHLEWLTEMKVIEGYFFVAPFAFILIHILRPLFFLPVLLLCITGGILFGVLAGTIYSLIGLMLSSVLFYLIMRSMPKLYQKCEYLEQKWLGKKTANLTIWQISLLRLLPFMHFHLLSFYIYERSDNFAAYLRTTLVTVTPLTVIYTIFGQTMQSLSLLYMIPFCAVILIFTYIFRRRQMIIKWHTFFPPTSH
ncbi:VTT domain-containing protein [Gracilibacillus xinjiangensis]|uniref:TVP38/TMEM64 family membrane protein n=1 Tax=Gracilibacillus xinjiangensis TaxID=1193282 RepID=A0ABV8WYP2_9BACI